MSPTAHRTTGTHRKVAPWKHTDRDRGWRRRKAAADARDAAHVHGPTCKAQRKALAAA